MPTTIPYSTEVLTAGLVLGGVPPMLSGIMNSISPRLYTSLMAPLLVEMFDPELWEYTQMWMRLQGGDAFGAGAERLVAAFFPECTQLRIIFAFIGIGHSCYEIWLLPQGIHWARHASMAKRGEARRAMTLLILNFIILHFMLVVLFAYGGIGECLRIFT